jgi:hypothetical protein
VEDLAVILAVVGLGGVAVWLLTRDAGPTGVIAPAPDQGIGNTLTKVAWTAITNPNAINHAVFGVGTDTFKTFGEKTAAQQLGVNMCNCYHGNQAACKAALEQSPGLRCKAGDCDCHITDTAGQVIHDRDVTQIHYRDSHGGPYTANVGKKVPVGGCQPPIDANVASNRANGYCVGLV